MNLPKTEKELKELCVEFAKERASPRSDLLGYEKAYDAFITRKNKPKLIDGLTKEQWAIVIKDELICEFWTDEDDEDDELKLKECIIHIEYDDLYPFTSKDSDVWWHCRIHPSQPQFNTGKKPDWLDDKQLIACKMNNNELIYMEAGWFTWSLSADSSIIRWQVVNV